MSYSDVYYASKGSLFDNLSIVIVEDPPPASSDIEQYAQHWRMKW